MKQRQREFPSQHDCLNVTSKRLFLMLAVSCLLLTVAGQSAFAQTFQHPGVLVSRAQLDFIKQQVANKVDPIYSEFLKAQSSRYGSTSPYTPQGPPSGGVIQCGSFSNPDIGCSAEDEDGTTAYTQALLYWITGNNAYAQNAIRILNAYGHNLVNYTDSNGPLQAGWGASKWARAAEIIRYSNAGWSASDAQTFGTMMNNAMLPNIINGSGNNGNWELSMIEGMIGIAVYNNDSSLFNHAVTFWHQRVPAYFYYFPVDGSSPVPPPRGSLNWNGQTVFNNTVNGVAQETCRDFGHTEFGIAAAIAAAETAHIQGVDLYGSEKPRLEATLEFHAHYLLGNTVPSSVCGGHVTLASRPTFEIGYNEYHNRLGDSLPDTLQWLMTNIRTQSLEVDHHMMVFETLSHGADAGAGAPQPDFSLAASPGSVTVVAGNSASFTATVAPINGFTASVGLSVSGLPSGATSSFNPSSVSGGSGSSTLTVATSSSTPPGNYTLTITGTSGSTSHTASVTLIVNAPPDFSLAASPGSQTVIIGNGASYTVNVGALNGFSGTVTLSVSGAPAGVTAALNPISVSGSGSSTLSVSTSSTAATGTYTLTITGTSGSLTHSKNVTLVVSDFSLSVCSSPLTVVAGSSATCTVTVNPVNSYAGMVSLSASGLPSGGTASFNPASIGGGSGSSTLTVSAASTTTPGSYTTTIKGTDSNGILSHSTTITLQVNPAPPPDFTLAASPASRTITAGGSTTYTVTVNPANGYSGLVALSVSGLPASATASFNPASISGGLGSSTLTVTTSGSAASNSTLTITGTDSSAGLSHSANVTLVVNPVQQCVTASSTWQNTAIANQTGTFTVAFDATPSASPINAVIGLSGTAAATYTDLATIVRFNPSGAIDARNGGAYNAAAVIPYSAGVTYHFRMVVNVPAHTYSVFVTAPGGTEQTVGSNFAFRSEQSTVSQLSWWSAFASSGSETVCNFALGSGGTGDFSLTASPSTLTMTAGTSASSTVNVAASGGFSGTVALGVSGAPAGMTVGMNPSSVSGSGSSTLNITTSASTAAGSYTLTVTGTSGSLTHSASVMLTVNASPPVCVTTTANGPWQNTAFTNQTGSFTAEFDATPSASPINAVVGLSNGAAAAYADLATIARFNPSGNIDARDGGAYNMASTIPYTGGVKYHFRMVVNVLAHTYSVFVTAPGGTEQTVGSNFAFRTEQNAVTQLNWWGAFSGTGSETVCSFAIP